MAGLKAMTTASLPVDDIQGMQASSLLIFMTETTILTYDIANAAVRLVNTLSFSSALSIALAPDEDILAVGTPRGSVALYNPNDGVHLATIVEVESGWQPFQLHFAGREWLLTSYEKEENLNHIMRQFTTASGKITITQTSSLGNLCFPAMPAPGNAQVGFPSITFMYIEEWRLGILASSRSEDSEIFQLEDEEWVIWRMSEDAAPQMHYYNNDVTLVLGLSITFNDMSTTFPLDPDDPPVNPMPTIIYLNSAWFFLSYRMVDFKKNASCKALRNSIPLPPAPSLPAVPTPTSVPSPAPLSAIESDTTVPTEIDITPTKETAFTSSFHSSMLPRARPIAESTETESSSESSSDGRSGSEADSLTDESRLVGDSSSVFNPAVISPSLSTPPNTSHSMKPPIPVESLTDTTPFLSNFKFPKQASPQPALAPKLESGFGNPQQKTPTNFSNSGIHEPQPPSSSIPQPSKKLDVLRKNIPLPTVRLQPRLDQAMDAMKQSRGDDPLTAVQSIMSEMEADLTVTEQAANATWEELDTLKDDITSMTDETTKQLSGTLQMLLQRYEAEKQLRASATETMTQILKLHRDYETIRMEDGVRVHNGPSNNLRAEYKTADELMSQREAEITKMIQLIEDKLGSPRVLRNRGRDPAENLQMIYSSLSLQGLRIKRVLSLLTSLKDRVKTDEGGGRRSDLGLSLARLEKLSLGSELESMEKGKSLPKQESMVARENAESGKPSSDDISENAELLPKDVVEALRQLAMRQGRECISLESTPRRKPSSQRAASMRQGVAAALNLSPEFPGESVSGAKPVSMPPKPGMEDNGFSLTNRNARAQNVASGFGTSFQRQAAVPTPPTEAGPSSKPKPSQLAATSPLVGTEISSLTGSQAGSPFAKLDVPSTGRASTRGKWTTVQTSVARPPVLPHKKLPATSPQPAVAKPAYASLPPDDHEPTSMKVAPSKKSKQSGSTPLQTGVTPKSEYVSTKRRVDFAALPPDGGDGDLETDGSGAASFRSGSGVEGLVGTKASGAVEISAQGERGALGAKGGFAALPPEDGTSKKSGGLFATLPPEDDTRRKQNKPSSAPPKSEKSEKKGGFAALPPDEDRGSKRPGVFAALPPDDDSTSKKGVFAALPPDGDNASKKGSFAGLPPDNDKTVGQSSLFAPLPPDRTSITTSTNVAASTDSAFTNAFASAAVVSQTQSSSPSASGFGTFSGVQGDDGRSGASGVFAQFASGNEGGSSQASSHSPEMGLFGSALSLGPGASSKMFTVGQPEASSTQASGVFFASSSAGASSNTFSSAFASGGLAPPFGGSAGGDSSMFGAAADLAKGGQPMVGRQSVENDASSSDDSDGGTSFQRRQGMDDAPSTSVQPSGFSSSATGSAPPFGNTGGPTGFSNFSGSDAQASASPFDGSGPGGMSAFGQGGFGTGNGGSAQVSPSGFGQSQAVGGGNATAVAGAFGTTGFGGNSAFGNSVSPPAFGVSSSFGAPSSLGGGTPGQGTPQQTFGTPSAFGQPSPFGGVSGASPFASPNAQGGFGAPPAGGSAFAALAVSGSGLSFGSGQPPSFTSAAFSERRA